MIKSFKHRGLKKFFEDGLAGRISPDHRSKLERILDRLDASVQPQDMNLPGYRLHRLKGARKNCWAVDVSGNWRVTFRFEGSHAMDVDYCDYH